MHFTYYIHGLFNENSSLYKKISKLQSIVYANISNNYIAIIDFHSMFLYEIQRKTRKINSDSDV